MAPPRTSRDNRVSPDERSSVIVNGLPNVRERRYSFRIRESLVMVYRGFAAFASVHDIS